MTSSSVIIKKKLPFLHAHYVPGAVRSTAPTTSKESLLEGTVAIIIQYYTVFRNTGKETEAQV